MTDVCSIVRAIRHSVELLNGINDGDAELTAQALARWLAGCEDFSLAANLVPGWRQHVRQKEIDAALLGLMKLHPNVDGAALARHAISGAKRANVDCPRPGDEAGLFFDLARTGFDEAERTCRGHISELRGGCNAGIGHVDEAPSPAKLELKNR